MSNVSKKTRNRLAKAFAVFTATTTVLSLLVGAVAVRTAQAVTPADYGLHEGDVIRATGDIDVYIVNDGGYKRLFVNPAIFNLYGHLGFAQVQEVSPAVREAFPTSGLFRNCETGDQKVYGLEVVSEDVANLHWVNVTGAEAVSQDPNFFKKVFCINTNEQNLYGMGAAYTSLSQIPPYARGGASPTPTPGPGGLNGGAGSLDSATFISSLNSEQVGEGDSNVKIVGYDIDADSGSDLRLTSLRLEFEEQGAGGSTDLDDYADNVSVWFGSMKVGESDVSDFSEDAGVWSKSISLSGDPIIRMSDTGKLYVAVSALDNIDSGDLGSANNDWDATMANLRYVDAQGAVVTEDTLDDIGVARPFYFDTFAAAGDVELKLAEKSDNPDAGVIEADTTSSTDGVVLLSTTLKAIGSDIKVREMTFDVTPAGTGDASQIAGNYTLEFDGDEVQSLNSTACTVAGDCDGTGAAGASVSYTFDDVDKTIDEGDTVTVRLLTDVNDIDAVTFDEGDSLFAVINNDDTNADDQNGDQLSDAETTGAVTGNEQAFYSEGIVVELIGTPTFTKTYSHDPNVATDDDQGTATIKFRVTPFGTDAYVDKSDPLVATSGTASDMGLTGSGSFIATITSTGADEQTDSFKVDEGSSEDFTITAIVTSDTTGSAFFKVSLDGILYAISGDVDGDLTYDFNLDDFETDPLSLFGSN